MVIYIRSFQTFALPEPSPNKWDEAFTSIPKGIGKASKWRPWSGIYLQEYPKAFCIKLSSYFSGKCTRLEKTRYWDLSGPHDWGIKAGNSVECESHCFSQSACVKATWVQQGYQSRVSNVSNCFLIGATTSTRITEEDGFTSFTCGGKGERKCLNFLLSFFGCQPNWRTRKSSTTFLPSFWRLFGVFR